MAMAKFLALMLLAMFALSMLQTTLASASETRASLHQRRGRYGNGSLKSYQCPGKCSDRCKNVGHHHEACMFFCQKCCKTCLCVPPGTYGNKAMCPCYNNWKTQQGGPKCP